MINENVPAGEAEKNEQQMQELLGDNPGDVNVDSRLDEGGVNDAFPESSGKKEPSLLDAVGSEEDNGLSGEVEKFDFSTGEKPENFPEEFWDVEGNTPNVQAMYDSFKKQEKIAGDLRRKMSTGEHKVPKEAGEYKVELAEEFKEFVKDDDPMLNSMKEIAHKHNLPQDMFDGFMQDAVAKLVENANEGMSEEQAAALEKEHIDREMKALGPNGPQKVRMVNSFIDGAVAQGRLTEEAGNTLKEEGMTSARLVQALNEVRANFGVGQVTPVDNTVDMDLPDDSAIAKMIADAYDAGDEAEVKRIENKYYPMRKRAGRPDALQVG